MAEQQLFYHSTEEQKEAFARMVEHWKQATGQKQVVTELVQSMLAEGSKVLFPDMPDLHYPAPDSVPDYDPARFASIFAKRLPIMGFNQTTLAEAISEKTGLKIRQSYISERLATDNPRVKPAAEVFRAAVELLQIRPEEYRRVMRARAG